VHNSEFEKALISPVEVLYYMDANLLNIEQHIKMAHEAKKHILIHIDLAEGIGKDKAGVQYLSSVGADGIISTRTNLIKFAKEFGLVTVQRFFAIDFQGIDSISSTLVNGEPDFMEIMPGVVGKVIKHFANGDIPLITGGLIECKAEVMSALEQGAFAVSTGKEKLWYI